MTVFTESEDCVSFVSGGVVGAGVFFCDDSSGAHKSIKNFGIFNVGNLISISFFLITSFVVAMYKGIIAKINIVNTKPPKPLRRACNNTCHWCKLKILKLNKIYDIVHTKKQYHNVHDMVCLLLLKSSNILLIFLL